nr:reverse transcriptase domain-containing protein [Tanacetum cinerariifolium]
MTDNRTMAEMLRTPTEGCVEAIVVPPILAEQFELKHSLINMMTSKKFFGLEKDNPHDHVRWVVPRNYNLKGEMFLIASRFPTPPLACAFFSLRATETGSPLVA